MGPEMYTRVVLFVAGIGGFCIGLSMFLDKSPYNSWPFKYVASVFVILLSFALLYTSYTFVSGSTPM